MKPFDNKSFYSVKNQKLKKKIRLDDVWVQQDPADRGNEFIDKRIPIEMQEQKKYDKTKLKFQQQLLQSNMAAQALRDKLKQ